MRMMVNSNIVASTSGGRPDGIDEMYLMTVDVVFGRNFEQIILDFITTSSVTTCLPSLILFFCYYSAMQSIFVHSSSIGSRWDVMGVR